MKSVRDWQSYQASALVLQRDRATILYWPCREHPTRVTYCKPDDSIKDHKRVAVISRPGFTGPLLIFLDCSHQSSRLCQGFILAFAGKETLFVEGLTGLIPAEQFTQEVPGNHGHGLVARHLSFVFFLVVDLAIETPMFNQWQGYDMQDLSEQPARAQRSNQKTTHGV